MSTSRRCLTGKVLLGTGRAQQTKHDLRVQMYGKHQVFFSSNQSAIKVSIRLCYGLS